MTRRGYGMTLALVIVACGTLYLVGNDRVALWDRDEPRYALASKWMLEHGDWIVPRVGWGDDPTEPRTAKPILIYWCQAAAMAVFGVGSFAARFPSSVAMVATLCLLAGVLWRFIGPRRAVWAVLVLGTSAMVIVSAKMCVTDAVLLFFVTTAQICLCSIYLTRRRGRRPAAWVPVVMWVAIGLAGLTKGPVVLGVQLTTLLVLLLLDVGARWRERSAWRAAIGWWLDTRPVVGLGILVLICGPWLWMLHVREPAFLPRTIGHDVIRRSTQALEGHKGPPGFYLVTIFGTFFPWSLLLPMAVGFAIRHRRLAPIRFALAAVVGPWLMMELVATKLVHYVLPIFPPLAFLVADAMVRCFCGQYPDLRSRLAVFGTGAWALIVAALGVAPWLGWYYFYDFPKAAAATVTVTMLAWATVAYLLVRRHRAAAGMAVIGGGMIAVMLVIWGWFIPASQYLKVGERVGRTLAEHGATDVVMLHRYREQSVAFYQGGSVREAHTPDLLLSITPAAWPQWIVVEWDDWRRVPDDRKRLLEKVAAFDGINIAKGDLVHVMVMRRTADAE